MKITQKLFLLISLIFSTTIANAQYTRQTSFDNRQICDENKGVWREFGNGCGDNCESKFDKYEICTSALTYACDCGKGRCWYENKCLSLSAYKKIFDKANEEKEKFLEAKVKARQERIKKDPALNNYLQNLYVKKDTARNVQNQQQAIQNQGASPTGGIISQVVPQQEIATQPPLSAITPVQGVRASAAAPATAAPSIVAAGAGNPAAAGNQEIKIPPAFLQQEQDKQKAANPDNAQPPQLPVIPLPQ